MSLFHAQNLRVILMADSYSFEELSIAASFVFGTTNSMGSSCAANSFKNSLKWNENSGAALIAVRNA